MPYGYYASASSLSCLGLTQSTFLGKMVIYTYEPEKAQAPIARAFFVGKL